MKRSAGRAHLLALAVLIALASRVPLALASQDALPSWNAGANKQAVVEFVTAVSTPGGADFVPPADRVATFDMDGTLVVEKPEATIWLFALAYLKQVATTNPSLDTQPYRAARANDMAFLNANPGMVIAMAGVGLTNDEYREEVKTFAETSQNPHFKVPYAELFYLPMRELITYLKANDFRVYIVSGSLQEFGQGLAAGPLGLPLGQILGGQVALEYQPDGSFIRTGTLRQPGAVAAGKPINIEYQIGQKPILAFGNTSGDQQMFEYTLSHTEYRRLALWLDHDDAEREMVYDSHVTPIDGLLKVSMKNDFARLFGGR